MKKLIFLALPLAATAALAPAARAQAGTPPPGPPAQAQPQSEAPPVHRAAQHRRDRIEHDELAQAHGSNAYDIITSLRPSWLNRHRPALASATGGDNMPEMIVIVDGAEMGDPDALKSMSPQDLYSVEFLSQPAMEARFGKLTRSGGIVVHTSAQDDPGAKPTN
jgi:hypothetical protein